MATTKDVYLGLKNRILDNTSAKTSGLYNSQFDNLEEENAFSFPAAFIEFVELEHITRAGGVQRVEAKIRLHIGYDSLKTEDLAIMDLLEELQNELQGYRPDVEGTPLNRVFKGQDINHGVIAVWLMDYDFSYIDYSGDRNRRLTETQLSEIDIVKKAAKPWLNEG